MHLYVVRHGKAGSRRDWDGPDHKRPLSKKGRRQADALVGLLFDKGVERVLSSPFVRCVETVEPLADKLGLHVEIAETLAEGARTKDAMGLVRSLEVNAVLCSHGDVVPKILDALADQDGLDLPPDYPYAKGSTWDLLAEAGKYVQASYIAPPA
ncbi:MAG TPA: phosphoglycerate mutase family protein [Acidimicrobiales bacterium]|jgi:8-oxo-dGTP diphosphatase